MHYKRKCPKCDAADKIVKRCYKCLKLCCRECSVAGFCLDCYLDINIIYETNTYFKDKYSKFGEVSVCVI